MSVFKPIVCIFCCFALSGCITVQHTLQWPMNGAGKRILTAYRSLESYGSQDVIDPSNPDDADMMFMALRGDDNLIRYCAASLIAAYMDELVQTDSNYSIATVIAIKDVKDWEVRRLLAGACCVTDANKTFIIDFIKTPVPVWDRCGIDSVIICSLLDRLLMQMSPTERDDLISEIEAIHKSWPNIVGVCKMYKALDAKLQSSSAQ